MVLHQRLEQRLVLQQIRALAGPTADEAGAEEEYVLLGKILDDINSSVYADVPDFLERIGKRVPKKERDEWRKAIVAHLRALVPACGISALAGVRDLVDIGVHAYEKFHDVPSETYGLLHTTVSSPAASGTERAGRIFRLVRGNMKREQPSAMLVPLFAWATVQPQADGAFLDALLSGTEAASDKVLDRLGRDLPKIGTDTDALKDVNRLERAVALLCEFEDLLGHLHLEALDLFRGFLANGSDASRAANLPPTAQAFLAPGLSDAALEKVNRWFAERYVAESADAKRGALQAFLFFRRHQNGLTCQEHLVRVAEHAEAFVRLSRLITQIGAADAHPSSFPYPLEAATSAETIHLLSNHGALAALATIPFQEGGRTKFVNALDTLSPLLVKILFRLASIYQTLAPEALPALARIAEAAAEGNFKDWRYTHGAAEGQLRPLKAAGAAVWRQNARSVRILRPIAPNNAKLQAFRLLKGEMAAAYERVRRAPWTETSGNELEQEVMEKETTLRTPGTPADVRKSVVDALKPLRIAYKFAKLAELFDTKQEEFDFVRRHFASIRSEPWASDISDLLGRALEILDAKELTDLRTVVIEETDDLLDLLQVGVQPVLSCQRWVEATAHNRCLMAYVADANKKLWLVRDAHSREVVGRAVVRLFPFKKSNLLLVEPPYASSWSEDHTRLLLLSILQKAGTLAEATGKPFYVGFIGCRRWNAWGTTFEEVAKATGIEPVECNFQPTLPQSLNSHEYTDSLGGDVPSGYKLPHVARLCYLAIGEEE